MVFLRPSNLNKNPPPAYKLENETITVSIFYGGRMYFLPIPQYKGGHVAKFDYVEIKHMSLYALKGFANQLNLGNNRKWYKMVNSGFQLLATHSEVKDLCKEFHLKKEVYIYVETDEDNTTSYVESELETTAIANDLSYEHMFDDYHFESQEEGFIEIHVQPSQKVNNLPDNTLVAKVKNLPILPYNNDDSVSSEEDMVYGSECEMDSEVDSDYEDGSQQARRHTPYVQRRGGDYDPQFARNMRFSTKQELRKAIHAHAAATLRNLKINRNDERRLYAKCAIEGCPWKVNAHIVKGELTHVIHTYHPEHKCGKSSDVRNVKSTYLAERYLTKFKSDPKRSLVGFMSDVYSDIKVNISKDKAYRTKQKALHILEGDPALQYSKLWDYAEELRKRNPGSTIIVDTDDQTPQGRFKHFYCCFNALKDGFLSGCRPLIGVDGAHLSGPHKGVLLTAVGIDPNDKLYPIAYAVVGKESGETWDWFLTILKEDLKIERNSEWTFISDKQKGLIKAFGEVFPGASHRFCIRHLWKNMYAAGFRGDAFKNALLKAGNATTEGGFKAAMQEIKDLDPKAHDWLMDKEPAHWSKAYFGTYPKCDMILNNFCECFNSQILEAREKPILTMLEWIREFQTQKLQKCRDNAQLKWSGRLCPKIVRLVQQNMEEVGDFITLKCDDYNYQITHCYGDQYCVNLQMHSCTCRRWDLTGIPCKHACAAMSRQRLDPMQFVHNCYTIVNYTRAYSPTIYGINGQELWGETFFIPPLPPNFGRNAGRPAKARRRGEDEGARRSKGKGPKRMQTTLKCSYCGEEGHNKRRCPLGNQEACQEPIQPTRLDDGTFDVGLTNATLDANLTEVTISIGDVYGEQPTKSSRATKKQKVTKGSTSTGYNKDQHLRGPYWLDQLQQGQVRPPNTSTENQFIATNPPEIPTQEFSTRPHVIIKGGKNYVTVSNIAPAMKEMEKGKRKGKGKGKGRDKK